MGHPDRNRATVEYEYLVERSLTLTADNCNILHCMNILRMNNNDNNNTKFI